VDRVEADRISSFSAERGRCWGWGAGILAVMCVVAAGARADVVTHPEVSQARVAAMGLAAMRPVRDPAPEPDLGPGAVVGIVLHALQHNDDPVADHGIAVTFAFTSPENRDVTGPIDRFRALVKSSAYRSMIDHTRADRGPVTVVAEHAREQVAITGMHGERVVYLFLLSRQETGAYKGCWMADGVLREGDTPTQTIHPLMTALAVQRY
jgi:hypothetical protein